MREVWYSNQGWTDTVDQTQTEIPLLLTLDIAVSLLKPNVSLGMSLLYLF
jgi:hypothetical protein